MNIVGLAVRNIKGNNIRSLIIFLAVLGIACFFISTTLIVRGAENSLNTGLARLGADIVVIPPGTDTKIETALLMGKPSQVWMSADYLKEVADVAGVALVSPQIYLQSLFSAACCSVSETFLVVFDPATDFTVTPWLKENLGRSLAKDEVIGGSYIFVPAGEKYIRLYGKNLILAGNLKPTGTGLDQTIFLTRETAEDIASSSAVSAEQPLDIPNNQVSAILVKLMPGTDRHKVALQMAAAVRPVIPIEASNLFGTFRDQMMGLLWVVVTLLIFACVLSAVLISLVFSLATNERRREIAILRALGAKRLFIFRSLLAEVALLALIGGTLGIILGGFGTYLFKDFISGSLKMPFLFPSPASLSIMLVVGVGLCMAVVTLAALFPALRISNEEPALAMRE